MHPQQRRKLHLFCDWSTQVSRQFSIYGSNAGKLVDVTDKSGFKLTRKEFGDQTETVLRKRVYPYEYIDSLKRFDENHLPPIDKFYSKRKRRPKRLYLDPKELSGWSYLCTCPQTFLLYEKENSICTLLIHQEQNYSVITQLTNTM